MPPASSARPTTSRTGSTSSRPSATRSTSSSEAAARSGDIIAVLKVFEDSHWPLAKQLVYVPPALTGIILASVSGLFGALLITLILFVYPDNRYKFTRTKSYYGRILLGGLIALGVFVLMFSGVAVLAGPNASGSAQNLIAYGGIGILAGMFSDQAAGWLSDRSVFKPEDAAAADGGGRGGGGRPNRASPSPDGERDQA